MIELSLEQRKELDSEVPRALDPQTGLAYVLVSEDVYERLQSLLAPSRLPLLEQRVLLNAAGRRAGWDDPEMDIYDREEAIPELP